MKVLVTGATGFIGSAVVQELLAAGHEVLALARSESSLEGLGARGATPLAGDVRDPSVLAGLEPDAAIHLASAPTEGQGSREYARIDVGGATNLVENLSRSTHILYASSIWVYGTAAGRIDENSPVAPRTGLGTVKLAVERVLEAARDRTVFRIGIIYPGGAFGRQVIEGIRLGRYFCPGRGNNLVGIVSIADVASAFRSAVERRILGLYNWVDDEPLSWREMGIAVAEALGRRPPRHVPAWLVRIARGRDLHAYVRANLEVSNSLARDRGFTLAQPRFRDAIRRFLAERV